MPAKPWPGSGGGSPPELASFKQFGRRVAGIEPVSPSQDAPAGGTTLALDAGDVGLVKVRRGYRETVMAVDHYGEITTSHWPRTWSKSSGGSSQRE